MSRSLEEFVYSIIVYFMPRKAFFKPGYFIHAYLNSFFKVHPVSVVTGEKRALGKHGERIHVIYLRTSCSIGKVRPVFGLLNVQTKRLTGHILISIQLLLAGKKV